MMICSDGSRNRQNLTFFFVQTWSHAFQLSQYLKYQCMHPAPSSGYVVWSPFGVTHHVEVQYVVRWMKCLLHLPPNPLPPTPLPHPNPLQLDPCSQTPPMDSMTGGRQGGQGRLDEQGRFDDITDAAMDFALQLPQALLLVVSITMQWMCCITQRSVWRGVFTQMTPCQTFEVTLATNWSIFYICSPLGIMLNCGIKIYLMPPCLCENPNSPIETKQYNRQCDGVFERKLFKWRFWSSDLQSPQTLMFLEWGLLSGIMGVP